jgi:hypothetical protein
VTLPETSLETLEQFFYTNVASEQKKSVIVAKTSPVGDIAGTPHSKNIVPK